MRPILAALAIATISAAPARAQSLTENTTLTASDADVNDQFGGAVAISGTTAVIGSFLDDDNDLNSGSAYLFDTTTGQQLFKLLASDGQRNDFFGSAVAISGSTAIVGARGDDTPILSTGSAYLFNTNTGQQLFKLVASDGASSDEFGFSVAISGTTAVVGAYGDNTSVNGAGSAYIFDTTTGQQLRKITLPDANQDARFGYAVAITGTTAIIGAPGGIGEEIRSGAAYVYDTTTGQQLAKLTASDGELFDLFGSSVAISGSMAIVGAPVTNDAGTESGSAYVFDITTGQQLFKLVSSDLSAFDRFARSVAISGTTAIVGATGDDNGGSQTGSAYVFDTTTGEQILKLTASAPRTDDLFGASVAISPEAAIIGTPFDDESMATDSGSVRVFYNIVGFDPCPTDLNNSGATDLPDLNLVLSNFGMTTTTGDTNNDGVVDLADLNAVLAAFGQPCP